MTVTREAVAPREPFATSHSVGRWASGWHGSPRSWTTLRREDPAAERERVLQYDAVEAIRRTGVLGLRVPASSAARVARCAMCCPW